MDSIPSSCTCDKKPLNLFAGHGEIQKFSYFYQILLQLTFSL